MEYKIEVPFNLKTEAFEKGCKYNPDENYFYVTQKKYADDIQKQLASLIIEKQNNINKLITSDIDINELEYPLSSFIDTDFDWNSFLNSVKDGILVALAIRDHGYPNDISLRILILTKLVESRISKSYPVCYSELMICCPILKHIYSPSIIQSKIDQYQFKGVDILTELDNSEMSEETKLIFKLLLLPIKENNYE